MGVGYFLDLEVNSDVSEHLWNSLVFFYSRLRLDGRGNCLSLRCWLVILFFKVLIAVAWLLFFLFVLVLFILLLYYAVLFLRGFLTLNHPCLGHLYEFHSDGTFNTSLFQLNSGLYPFASFSAFLQYDVNTVIDVELSLQQGLQVRHFCYTVNVDYQRDLLVGATLNQTSRSTESENHRSADTVAKTCTLTLGNQPRYVHPHFLKFLRQNL